MSKKLPITSTSKFSKVTTLIYGRSKMGKTPLAATAKNPLFLDAENRMISVRHLKIPRIPITTYKELIGYIKTLASDKKYQNNTIILDSLSELARRHFRKLKKKYKSDPNKFIKYDRIYDDIMDLIDLLVLIPQDVIVICKQKPISLEDVELYRPLLPGQALIPEIPYKFDLVMNLRTWTNDKGDDIKFLQTFPNEEYEAGDSSGKLDKAEYKMDMQYILNKVKGKK